jgi:hypothetical protein
MQVIRNMVSGFYVVTSIQAFNIYDPTDFYTTGTVGTVNGGQAGEVLPPFVAFGFRSTRTTRAVRRATKRFAGVTEGASLSGGGIAAADLGRMDAVAAAMTADLEYDDSGSTLSYSPVVLGRLKYTVPSSGKDAYKYYFPESLQLEHIKTGIGWEKYTTQRSQVSRQIGHGG